jgi:hypothetical protein
MAIRLELEGGKYTIVQEDKPHQFYALRHGEKWRDLTGDGLVLALCQQLSDTQELAQKLQDSLIFLQEEILELGQYLEERSRNYPLK